MVILFLRVFFIYLFGLWGSGDSEDDCGEAYGM
jgi:hypothetical protein